MNEETNASAEPQGKSTKIKAKKKTMVVISIVAAVVVVAGVGFFVWHEQPSFCNAVCHVPMDDYVEGYYSTDASVLASTHAQGKVTCLGCHEANLGEQVAEGVVWVSGSYSVPLEKRDFASEENCLSSGCHNMSREELTQKTANLPRNPHDWSMHGSIDYACGDCHSIHDQQVDQCAGCHGDIELAQGWTAPSQAE